MATLELKLRFQPSAVKVKITLTRELVINSKFSVDEFIEQARKKMDFLKREKKIIFYIINEKIFKQCWISFLENSAPPKKEIIFILAEGCPDISEFVKVQILQNGKNNQARITLFNEKQNFIDVRFSHLLLYVNYAVALAGVTCDTSEAYLFKAYSFALQGISISQMPCSSGFKDAIIPTKPLQILASPTGKDVLIVINDFIKTFEKVTPKKICKMVSLVATTISKKEKLQNEFHIFESEIIERLKSALTGVESLNFKLPLVLLGASIFDEAEKIASPLKKEIIIEEPNSEIQTPASNKTPMPPKVIRKSTLKIKVSDDLMEAVIESIDKEIWENQDLKLDEAWLTEELIINKIAPSAFLKTITKVLPNFVKRDKVDGLMIAQGRQGTPGSLPYFKSAISPTSGDENTAETKDFRASQILPAVKIDQLVATALFKDPAKAGQNVFGDDIPPPDSPLTGLELGVGIRQEKFSFYATENGSLLLDEKKIRVIQSLIHPGNVNLTSGNVEFNGPIEITGSVDVSTIVKAKEQLIVKGSINGGLVNCKGNIEIIEGVSMGRQGRIIATGNLRASFIENSIVHCGGDLFVKKAIINSDIVCGGSIYIEDQENGVIAGSNVSFRNLLYATNLGFKMGSKTEIYAGADWVSESKIRHRMKRLENLRKKLEDDEATLAELKSRKKAISSDKDETRKSKTQINIKRLKKFCKAIETDLKFRNVRISYNQDAKILVSKTIFANCLVEACGSRVVLEEDMMGVGILCEKKRAQKILSIEDVQSMIEKAKEKDEKKKKLDAVMAPKEPPSED